MASPDFRDYIDLTVNDLQPEEIYELAKEYAILSLPEFNPRTGTVEDALLQSMSFVSGLVTGAINRLPNNLIEGMMRLLGFYRREATFSKGNVIFTAIDTAGLTIPSGTQVAYSEVRDETTIIHIFETSLPVTIDEGDTQSPLVEIVATDVGVKPVIADGEYLTILTPIGRLLEAQFSGSLVQGDDSETDLSFFNRAATYFASLSASLATAEQATNYVLTSYPDAYRVKAYDLTRLPVFRPSVIGFDGTNGVVAIYPNLGVSTTYDSVEFIDDSTKNYLSIGQLAQSEFPSVDNATVIRIYDSSETEYDGIYDVLSGSISSDVIRMTFTPSGTERKFFCIVRAATTGNLSSLSGLSTLIDGVQLVAGDLVLVKNQTTGSQNGIYLASASAWTRIAELANGLVVNGKIHVFIDDGTANSGETWTSTNAGAVTIDSTAITFAQDTVLSFYPKVEILDTIETTAVDVPGAVTIFVSDSTGASLTSEQKALISSDISKRSVAGLSVYVTDVILANIGVSVVIGVEDGYSKLATREDVTAYLNNAISAASFQFAPLVRKNVLIADISKIAGVDYVQSLSFIVGAGSSALAYVDPGGDLAFNFAGVIPVCQASVGSV